MTGVLDPELHRTCRVGKGGAGPVSQLCSHCFESQFLAHFVGLLLLLSELRMARLFLLLLLLGGVVAGVSSSTPGFNTRPPRAASTSGLHLAYGPDSSQYGELRLPTGKGPFPVVVLIHGGCWLAQYDLHGLDSLSTALTRAGYATWNLEYRRVGNVGGGWPGTFQDVATGTDFVRELARIHPLLTDQVVVLGHSAGAELAMWLAARPQIRQTSPLYQPNPLKLNGVVSLAGILDLAAYATDPGSCNAAVARLLGGLPVQVPERYVEASPSQLLPLRVPLRLVHGTQDKVVPTRQTKDFAQLAQAAGDDVRLLRLPKTGHFELITPTSESWAAVKQTMRELLPINQRPVEAH